MNPPNIHRKPRLAATPEEMEFVLDNLTPESCVPFVAEKAKAQDIPWLYAMLRCGFFDAPDDLIKSAAPSLQHPRHGSKGVALVTALAAVVEGSTFNNEAYLPPSFPELKVSDDFKSFFLAAFNHFFSTFKDRHPDYVPGATPISQRTLYRLNQTCGPLLAAACAMNQPEAVKRIIVQVPASHLEWVDFRTLGEAGNCITGNFSSADKAMFNPAFAATLFSSHEALKVLEKHAGTLAMVEFPKCVKVPNPEDSKKPSKNGDQVGLMPFLLNQGLQCDANMLAHAVLGLKGNTEYRPMDQYLLIKAAMNDLGSTTSPLVEARIEGFLKAGVYDLDPVKSITEAACYRRSQVLEHFADRMPWPSLLTESRDNLLHGVMTSVFAQQEPALYDDMLVKLMLQAKEDGHAHRVFNLASPDHPVRVTDLIKGGFHKVLLCHLENGLDPDRKLPEGRSALEIAKRHPDPAAHAIVCSFKARKHAQSLLEEMGEPQKNNRP